MLKRLGGLCKCLAFLGIMLICLLIVERILIPKYLSDDKWETTTRLTGFYQMEKDSVDVLCLGSSRAAASVIPQLLYDEYGIRAYNLGFEQQSMVTAYFWLKEALRYQSPKAVLLHTYFLFDTGRPVLNAQEPMLRKAIDWMRWSPNKVEAIRTISRLAPTQKAFSYVFTYMNYHSRWDELTENDYDLSFMSDTQGVKGFEALRTHSGDTDYMPSDPSQTDEVKQSDPIMELYLNKIIELCEQKGIGIVLYDTPSSTHKVAMHNYEAAYADKKQVLFLDYGERSLYEEIGYQYASDNADNLHVNIWGAEKITRHLGKVLQEQFSVAGVKDAQWDSTEQAYQGVKEDCGLTEITDVKEYLAAINNDRYCIFLALQGDGKEILDEEELNGLRALGMNCSFEEVPGEVSYFAVTEKGKLIDEKAGMETVSGAGSIRNNRVMYEISSGSKSYGDLSSITLNAKEYSLKKNGWNLVVFSSERNRVLDQVCLTVSDGETVLNRKKISF